MTAASLPLLPDKFGREVLTQKQTLMSAAF
jgi:hypothetical protein